MTLRRILPAAVLLVAASVPGFGYVSWDDYYFTITDGTATLRRGGTLVVMCDRSLVCIVDNHLLMGDVGAPGLDIVIDDGTAWAIGNEFRRDNEQHHAHHRPPGPPLRPPERPQPPPPAPVRPVVISLPAAQVVPGK